MTLFCTADDLLLAPCTAQSRITQRLLALAAAIALDHQPGRPTRALATYSA